MVELEDINITSTDKDTLENIVSYLYGHLRPISEPSIFYNRTLDMFMKELILMLNEIKKEGSISKYLDTEGNLELKQVLIRRLNLS
jgi:hypothetical protein